MDWSSLLSFAVVGVMFFLMMRHGGGCCGGGHSLPSDKAREFPSKAETRTEQEPLTRE